MWSEILRSILVDEAIPYFEDRARLCLSPNLLKSEYSSYSKALKKMWVYYVAFKKFGKKGK